MFAAWEVADTLWNWRPNIPCLNAVSRFRRNRHSFHLPSYHEGRVKERDGLFSRWFVAFRGSAFFVALSPRAGPYRLPTHPVRQRLNWQRRSIEPCPLNQSCSWCLGPSWPELIGSIGFLIADRFLLSQTTDEGMWVMAATGYDRLASIFFCMEYL